MGVWQKYRRHAWTVPRPACVPQGLGEHLLTDTANALAEPGEPHLTLAFERVDDEQRPFVSDAFQDFPHERFFLPAATGDFTPRAGMVSRWEV